MDKDRIKGSANQIVGGVKRATGKLVGDTKLEAEGQAQKATGAVQSAVGGMKDAIRETFVKK
ncbi:MAG: CsbD family protein [Telmatospirillum sp.]|nr:CsbD family protein [Telmatospirillum sp.]